jgi:hypothetical protein
MHQRVRCPHCHHWTDALLVWAAGDCCPNCNAPIVSASPTPSVEDHTRERSLRSPEELSHTTPKRLSERP